MKVAVAMFDEADEARAAIVDLLEADFPKEQISLIMPEELSRASDASDEGDQPAKGGGIGAFFGGLVGVELATVVVGVAGMGPAVVAGGLAALLAGGAVGAAVGGVAGALIGAEISEAEAHAYEEAVRRGGALVLVQARDERIAEAARRLSQHRPVDLDARIAQWSAEGWTGLTG